MKIVQISDTHNKHNLLQGLPEGDVIIHCGDFSYYGTEEEVLDFLNWFIELPYRHKIFVTGNHDVCLWDADNIEDLPEDVHFLQDRGCTIEGVNFFGIGYNHSVNVIPEGTDVLITHEPPYGIMDVTMETNWGSAALLKKVMEIKPNLHLFGHAHEGNGIQVSREIKFSNGSVMNDRGDIIYSPAVFEI